MERPNQPQNNFNANQANQPRKYSEEELRQFNLDIDLHLTQHSSLLIPPIDATTYKHKPGRLVYENSIAKIADELKSKNIDKLKKKEVEKYASSIENIFNNTLMSDFALSLAGYETASMFQQLASRIIAENVLKKAIFNDKLKQAYAQIKSQSKKKQLELILGKPGSKGGLIQVPLPGMADMLRIRFKDNPMQLIGKQIEPFGPYAWNYGFFKAMNYYEALKNLTFIINGKQVKIFDNKSYSNPKNYFNDRNLLRLVQEYGVLLVRQYQEFEGRGDTIIGFFIDLSAKSRPIGMKIEHRFLVESYNIFEN